MRIVKQQNNQNRKSENVLVHILAFFLFTLSCIVFCVLCLNKTKLPFFQRKKTLFIVLSILLLLALCVLGVFLSVRQKQTLVKTLISVYIFLLFCLVLLFVLQTTGFFLVVQDEVSLQNFLRRAGIWMPLLYILLQYLQVVILPIPGIFSTLAGVALFGPFNAIIYSLIGIVLGSITAFFIGRKLGYKVATWLVGKDTLYKWQQKLKGKDNFILTAMFLLPLFPDDILCFLAGLSTMSLKRFVLIVTLTRIVSVSATCYSVNFIPFTTWWGVLIWVVLFALVIIACYILYKNTEKLESLYSSLRKKFKKDRRK